MAENVDIEAIRPMTTPGKGAYTDYAHLLEEVDRLYHTTNAGESPSYEELCKEYGRRELPLGWSVIK